MSASWLRFVTLESPFAGDAKVLIDDKKEEL